MIEERMFIAEYVRPESCQDIEKNETLAAVKFTINFRLYLLVCDVWTDILHIRGSYPQLRVI